MLSSVYTLLMVRIMQCMICDRREVPPALLRAQRKTSKFLLCHFLTLPLLVPSVPQDVTANSNGSTAVSLTWMEPVVFFREHSQCHHVSIVYRWHAVILIYVCERTYIHSGQMACIDHTSSCLLLACMILPVTPISQSVCSYAGSVVCSPFSVRGRVL